MTLTLLLALAAAPAGAHWTAMGSGSGAATTGTLGSPVDVTTPATAIAEVELSWTADAGGVTPDGYYVTRHAAGGATSPACSSGPRALKLGPSCTDTGVPDGDYTYVVTAVFASWTAPSAPSEQVSVSHVDALAFTTQPSNITVNETMTPPVKVALRTAANQPIAVAGVPVTLSIKDGPAAGTLAGVTTGVTNANGEVSFDGLSLDQAGAYTLNATSPNLVTATSAEFAVTAVPPAPLLGAAASYSVLTKTAVVSTGATSISGDVGVSPETAISGLEPDNVGGTIHAGDAHAAAAQLAMSKAYDDLDALPFPPANDLTGDLGGRTLTAGVYHSTAALALTGTLTLDAKGNPDATFVFQADAAFNAADAARVVLINGAKASNVFWVVTGATGAGADSHLSGTILSQGAITLGAGTELIGRALSKGTVTLAGNTIRFTSDLPPTMTIDGGPVQVTKNVTPTISGTTNAFASSPVTVTVGGQTLSTAVALNGTWTVTATTLTAGVHQITAKARSSSGDGATATQALTVEVNPSPVSLGTAASFSVLGDTGVVNTGVTQLSGDLGVGTSGSITGFAPGTLVGATHAGDAAAGAALVDLDAAIDNASATTLLPHTEIAGDLGGKTFHGGVHHSTAALALTGTVTLDGEGDPGAVFIFQTDAAFNTAASSQVVLTGEARAANVFWVVTGAAGTGANSQLSGSILARGAITLGAGTQLVGRALSLGTVTLASNTLTGITPGAAPALTASRPRDAFGPN